MEDTSRTVLRNPREFGGAPCSSFCPNREQTISNELNYIYRLPSTQHPGLSTYPSPKAYIHTVSTKGSHHSLSNKSWLTPLTHTPFRICVCCWFFDEVCVRPQYFFESRYPTQCLPYHRDSIITAVRSLLHHNGRH